MTNTIKSSFFGGASADNSSDAPKMPSLSFLEDSRPSSVALKAAPKSGMNA